MSSLTSEDKTLLDEAIGIIKKVKSLNGIIAQNQLIVEEIPIVLSTAELTKLTDERNKLKKRLIDIFTALTDLEQKS